MITKTHYFNYFPARPWPLLISLNLIRIFSCMAILFKFRNSDNLLISLVLVFMNIIIWLCRYGGELNLEGLDRSLIENRVKFSIILFISSEIFFFLSFFWSYFHYFLSPSEESRIIWPPLYLEIFNYLDIPLINTMVLLISGVTITISHKFFFERSFNKSLKYLIITVLLGLFFRLLQLKEYTSAFFRINDSTFGCNFFILTGFHGLHVIIGARFLLTVIVRRYFFRTNRNRVLRFELASWYWHFVDVVWIFLYFSIYYINNI